MKAYVSSLKVIKFNFPPPRLKKSKELQKAEDIKEVKQNIHLLRAPHAGKDLLYLVCLRYVNLCIQFCDEYWFF